PIAQTVVCVGSFTPLPRAAQLLPSHLAMLFADIPPAVVNCPAAYTSPPLIPIVMTRGNEPPSTPLPRADQLLPSHLAMPFAGTPPAVVKFTPAHPSPPPTPIA